ncbi:MAG: DUF4157 domain-containing protein [Patescibacteria group bacterium]
MKKTLIIATLVIFALFVITIFSPLLYGKRSLTEKELTILQPVYESSVDFDKVKIKSGGPLTFVYPGVTIGNTVSFPKDAYNENDQKDQALLVHELCHVWQYQHFGLGYIPRSLWELITQRDTYVIHYDAKKSFREYDIEEQCEIVAEYFLTEDIRYASYIEELRAQ